MKIEKRPGGDDYIVIVRIRNDGDYPVTVFGARDEADAIAEARRSFGHHNPEFEIISVEKL